MTITEFLLARFAEERWRAGYDARPTYVQDFLIKSDGTVMVNGEVADFEAYIDRYADPRRLVEIEAKRRIVERCDPHMTPEGATWEHEGLAMDVLGELASVYADHPDYRKEWRP